jgi:hypothetical protein
MDSKTFRTALTKYPKVRSPEYVDPNSTIGRALGLGAAPGPKHAMKPATVTERDMRAGTANIGATRVHPATSMAVPAEFWAGLTQLLQTGLPDSIAARKAVQASFEQKHFDFAKSLNLEDVNDFAKMVADAK